MGGARAGQAGTGERSRCIAYNRVNCPRFLRVLCVRTRCRWCACWCWRCWWCACWCSGSHYAGERCELGVCSVRWGGADAGRVHRSCTWANRAGLLATLGWGEFEPSNNSIVLFDADFPRCEVRKSQSINPIRLFDRREAAN